MVLNRVRSEPYARRLPPRSKLSVVVNERTRSYSRFFLTRFWNELHDPLAIGTARKGSLNRSGLTKHLQFDKAPPNRRICAIAPVRAPKPGHDQSRLNGARNISMQQRRLIGRRGRVRPPPGPGIGFSSGIRECPRSRSRRPIEVERIPVHNRRSVPWSKACSRYS